MKYLEDADFTLYQGDALETLRTLPDESVHCVVTSPPYWGLRDYGTEGQLGLEPTPDAYIANMVELFREVRRVLRRDGTCWLNLGDSYAQLDGRGNLNEQREPGQNGSFSVSPNLATVAENRGPRRRSLPDGFKRKDLFGIPWRVAFALQTDGWYLRSDIIWSKPNPMPESVTDRPTKAHEYLFLLTRSARYFYDADAIREAHQYDGRKKLVHDHAVNRSHENYANMGTAQERWPNGGRNARSVWEIATQPYAEAHFATFPEELARRCIAAGSPQDGVVLDPFMGSGTVARVARRLGRRSIGIELNPAYCELAARRLAQQSLLTGEAA